MFKHGRNCLSLAEQKVRSSLLVRQLAALNLANIHSCYTVWGYGRAPARQNHNFSLRLGQLPAKFMPSLSGLLGLQSQRSTTGDRHACESCSTYIHTDMEDSLDILWAEVYRT